MNPLNDNISKVELLDHMGSDLTVVNAARVSMAKESDWGYMVSDSDPNDPELNKRVLQDRDCKLITYLAKHGHWTPFSQPQIQLRIKMPIFIARQWFKHQVGFTRNEVSRRYVSEEPQFFAPLEARAKADNVKQGSSEELVDVFIDSELEDGTQANIFHAANELGKQMYQELLDRGVCPEQARMVLPQSMYTEFVETGSLAAYARLCKLRLDSHAQKEVQYYAEAVSKLIEPLFPVSWRALMNE